MGFAQGWDDASISAWLSHPETDDDEGIGLLFDYTIEEFDLPFVADEPLFDKAARLFRAQNDW
jgi:hypothetical protein